MTGEPYFTPGVPIQLDAKGHGEVAPGDLAVVRTGRGRARVEEVIGPADRVENVLEALLVERGARKPFERQELPEIEVANRVDLRDLLTYTIDPDTAKDFDDALSFQREPGGIRSWVHIADVSYFVGAGTPLDAGAAERALSTYVPGKVAPMLPHALADDACSLAPAPGSPVRHRGAAARRRRSRVLPFGDPLRRAADLRGGGAPRGAGGDPRVACPQRRARESPA